MLSWKIKESPAAHYLGLSKPLILSNVEVGWSLEAGTASKNHPKGPVPRVVPSRSQTTVNLFPQECLLGNVADYHRALLLLRLIRLFAILCHCLPASVANT